MNLKTKSAFVLSTLLVGGAVMAQAKAPEPDYTLGYNIGAVSDYRFRGIAQTSFDPALQGGVDFSHKSGVYLGAWASNVSWLKDYSSATQGTYELDLYGGYKGAITKDLGYDVGFISYLYPGNNVATNANTQEVYGALTYSMFTFKYSRAVSNFIGNASSAGSQYYDLSANFDLGSGFTLTPHIGYQTVPNQTNNQADYTDYALTLAKDMGNGLAFTVAAVGTDTKKEAGAFYTDTKGKYLGKEAIVVGVKYSF
ncbi:MAG: TorF family putative porin [Gammaproteobacteria bacterium]|nr:TorF family putative porin [Gammaproteobacteria bacterium]MBU0785265.1 TorF family putative porin [Gammaproteobacteria bacterium]MBU0815848.1 TorF family putative porin [Gammaproteobacteria bacterium]MBU1787387.1 TorF family putative porin [Gammaproteobacteria bacterium]